MIRDISYAQPYDWQSMLAFFSTHHLPHLESVDSSGYERIAHTRAGLGWFRVEHHDSLHAIRLSVWNATEEDVVEISAKVEDMFDLRAQPDILDKAMSSHSYLFQLWTQYPGLRVGRAWNGIESMFTTVLGQLVSVSFGRTLINELMRAAGSKARHPKTSDGIYLFPTAEQIIDADLSSVRTSEGRRTTIRTLAKLLTNGSIDWSKTGSTSEQKRALLAIPGVGSWTSEYIAMRALHDNDAFPATDYGLKKVLKQHPEVEVKRVRPWRAYAASALWRSFAEGRALVISIHFPGLEQMFELVHIYSFSVEFHAFEF